MKWFIFAAALATLAWPQLKPPALLEQALLRLPGVKILDPSTDLPGGYTIDEIKKFGYWPPWVVMDLDHDGRPDVVATVVKRGARGTQFGVLAIHANTRDQVHWVVRLAADRINGVSACGRRGDTVVPLCRIECDSNPWFSWSGQAYEAEFFAVGRRIAIGDETPGPMDTFSLPSRNSRLVARVKSCEKAKVLAVSGASYETRWYLVEVLDPKRFQAWIPASSAALEDDCPAE